MRPSLSEVNAFLRTRIIVEITNEVPEGVHETIATALATLSEQEFLAADGEFVCRYCIFKEVDEIVPATVYYDSAPELKQWCIVAIQMPELGSYCAHCGADLSPTAASTSTSSES